MREQHHVLRCQHTLVSPRATMHRPMPDTQAAEIRQPQDPPSARSLHTRVLDGDWVGDLEPSDTLHSGRDLAVLMNRLRLRTSKAPRLCSTHLPVRLTTAFHLAGLRRRGATHHHTQLRDIYDILLLIRVIASVSLGPAYVALDAVIVFIIAWLFSPLSKTRRFYTSQVLQSSNA
jgi:hypothetical protein